MHSLALLYMYESVYVAVSVFCVYGEVFLCLYSCIVLLDTVLEHPHLFSPPYSSDQYKYSENVMHYVKHAAALSKTLKENYGW